MHALSAYTGARQMSQDRTPARGVRVAGAAMLAVLALLDLAWIIRDFTVAAEVTDVWWMWSGLLFRAQDGVWASSLVEPTLLVLYTVCGVTALRSSSAAGILASTGTVTILLRVPTLWNLNANWIRGGVPDGLRSNVLYSVIAMLVLGVALLALAAAARRPVGTPESEPQTDPEGLGAPARPTPGGRLVACLLLVAVALVFTAWQVHAWLDQGWAQYSRHFAGDRGLVTLLAVPESWFSWAMTLLCLVAAFAALTRAPCSRPLGMTVSAPLLGHSGFALSFAAKTQLLSQLTVLGLRDQLGLATALFEILASLALLLALARRDEPAPEQPVDPGDEESLAASPPLTGG